VVGADVPPKPFSQVLIQVKLTQATPDGKQAVLCEPSLVTTLGRPVNFSVGGDIAPPRNVDVEEQLRYGTSLLVKVFRRKDQLFLDVSANVAELNRADVDSVRVTTTGLRVVEAITLGKAVVIPLPRGQKGQWELLVEEPQAKGPVTTDH